MTSPRAVNRNWRDSDSYLGHDNAIVWPIFMSPAEDDPRPHRCLTLLSGFAGHSLQGGKSTDYHAHANAEQYYYILSGTAEVRIEDDRFPVHEGSVAYFPPGVSHQLIGQDNPDWMQYLIITCPVPEDKLADGHTYRLYGSSHFISAKLSSEKFHGKKVHLEGVYDPATNWLHVHSATLTGYESPSRGFTGKE